jgi:hypothetical protein
MSSIPQSQPDGALYELVARGKKDIYFITNNPAEGVYPLSHKYNKIEPHLIERRTHVSRNIPQYGQTIEFELERYADVLLGVRLLIDMPTWLPDLQLTKGGSFLPAKTINKMTLVSATDGYCYGWTNGIAYFLIDTLELFQDKTLIYQTTGDVLWLTQQTDGSDASAFLRQEITGQHEGTPHQVAMNATANQLCLNIPWPGIGTSEYGFPLGPTLAHSYRIKIKLKKASQLIESIASDPNSTPLLPATKPWGKTFIYRDINNELIDIEAYKEDMMKPPVIMLETHQAYLRDDIRRELSKKGFEWETTFRRWFINRFPVNEMEYNPFDTGGQVIITRRLDGNHPTDKIFFIVRSQNDILQGRPWKTLGSPTVTNPDGKYWSMVKLLIAGREREITWSSLIYEDLNSLKADRSLVTGHGIINFSIEGDEMGGTINMSQADRPSIQIHLLDAISRNTEILVVSEGIGIYSIQNDRGYVRFLN